MVKVLVTGANGMLGQDLCPMLEDNDFEVVETDIDTLNITDEIEVNRVIKEEEPDLIIHCAAYTDVEGAEKEFDKAKAVNVSGTENLAKACAKNDITLVYISTDYVFDGTKLSAYLPEDKQNPINNYGLTKFMGESIVQKFCKKYYIVRTSWLYGHYGENFVEKMISMRDKAELKVVEDQIGCPTWTVDVANGIIDLFDNEESYGTYHICGGGKVSRYEFAKEIFSLMNMKVNIVPCKTSESLQLVKRPLNTVMNNGNRCRNWKLALKEYMELRIE